MSDADRPDDDGYTGPVTVHHGDDVVAATATLRGGVDPVAGSYHWYGRLAADPAVDALLERVGTRGTVVLRTPEGAAETGLADRDPWGRLRVEGRGRAPFVVLTDVAPTS